MGFRAETLKKIPTDRNGNKIWDGQTIPTDCVDFLNNIAGGLRGEKSIFLDHDYIDPKYMKVIITIEE